MKYLNLTKGFNPYGVLDEDCIKFESFFFNGGEPHIKIDTSELPEHIDSSNNDSSITITSRLNTSNDVLMLMIAYEAISQLGIFDHYELFIPYFPGARQDRRMIEGEPLTAKVYGDIINSMEFDNVITFDNHSDVSTALIDNCDNLDNHEFVDKCLFDIYSKEGVKIEENFCFISPDSGSNKKIKDLLIHQSKYWKDLSLVKCDKTRDVASGSITGFEVYSEDLEGKDCVIVDDICDGGGTFIGLAKELKEKNAGDIYLIVSHGIFSKPLKELQPYFKKIYTTDSWRSEFNWEQQERDCTDLVEIVEFKDFM